MKNIGVIAVGMLLIGILGGCSDKYIKVSLTPAITPNETGESGIPIDDDHFASKDFQTLLSSIYDLDKDGYLSEAERDSVIILCMNQNDLQRDGIPLEETMPLIDGLDYFSNLRVLVVGNAEAVLLKNHPSIRSIEVKGKVGQLYVENCPFFQSVSECYEGTIESYYISNAAPALFWERSYGNEFLMNKSVVYGNMSVATWNALDEEIVMETGEILDYGKLQTEWVKQTKDGRFLAEAPWEEYIVGQEIKLYEREICESEATCDTEGRKEWTVYIDHYDAADMGVFTCKLYTEESLTLEKIKVVVGKVGKVLQLSCSQKGEELLTIQCDLNVVFCEEREERVIGTIENKVFRCLIDEIGGVKIPYQSWSTEEECEEDGSALFIGEENITSPVFRRYIGERYGVGNSEGLTVKERESVLVMNFLNSVRFDGQTLDGFENFPKLTDLYLGNVETLIVENHPSLEVIGGEAIGLKKIVVRNCPKLERIALDLSEVDEVIIEDCVQLPLRNAGAEE